MKEAKSLHYLHEEEEEDKSDKEGNNSSLGSSSRKVVTFREKQVKDTGSLFLNKVPLILSQKKKKNTKNVTSIY